MPRSLVSLLLLRRISHCPYNSLILRPLGLCSRSFSSQNLVPDHPKPTSLSARLSFVFDQIDAIEKQRSERHQTLERIRGWRQCKQNRDDTHAAQENSELESKAAVRDDGSCYVTLETTSAGLATSDVSGSGQTKEKGVVELVHPWPEWIELMERLVHQNYFDHRRRNDDKTIQELGVDVSDLIQSGEDFGNEFFKDYKRVQMACLNFGKDRFDILRSLSRQDIQILVGYGCPSAERKVTFSAKLLRKRVHLDEGDVCSSCSLRNSCEKAYLLTNKEDDARTVDVMRILFTYGFDALNGSVFNQELLKQKSVKTVVRKLLHEIVKLSAVPIDPNLPPPVIKKPAPKVKQAPPPPKKRVGRDDIEMKKGDWLCPKCDFMNFAKNTVCLQCDAKRPKRQLLPGEWECPECNFLNYRRNMTCFHCECKRPHDEFMESKALENRRGLRRETEKIAKQTDVSHAWNFDFDDDESDGADVAAFEYADTSAMKEESAGNYEGSENDYDGNRRALAFNRGGFSDIDEEDTNQPVTGFNDFDDEDDVDSYEIDGENKSRPQRRAYSEVEDVRNVHGTLKSHHEGRNLQARTKNRKARYRNSESDELELDPDEEFSSNPRWKSSHVASYHRKSKSQYRELSFGSDEDLGLDSDMDDDTDDGYRKRDHNRKFSGKERSFAAVQSDEDDMAFLTKRSKVNQRGQTTGRSADTGRKRWDDGIGGGMRECHGRNNKFVSRDGLGHRMSVGRKGDTPNFRGSRQGTQGFGVRPRGRWDKHEAGDKERDYGEFRNSRRIIER